MNLRHVMLLLAGFAFQPAHAEWNAPNPEKAAALQLAGDARRGEEAFVICQGCHRVGAQGRADGSYPRLAGQHATVLIKQITDIRSDLRSNPKMLPFADHQSLSVQDIADIAAYLQQLPVPADHGQGAGTDLARGRARYAADCRQCHGDHGEGDASRFYPRLAGQHYRYLLHESQMIRDGERRNANPDMIRAIRNYDEADLAAVADYISRLPVR